MSAHKGEVKFVQIFGFKGRCHSEDRRRLEDNIKMNFRKMWRCELDLCEAWQGPVEGSRDHGNKPLGSINDVEHQSNVPWNLCLHHQC